MANTKERRVRITGGMSEFVGRTGTAKWKEMGMWRVFLDEPVNVPGTSTQYPNWRRKLHTSVEALASDARLARLCSALKEMRPRENTP